MIELAKVKSKCIDDVILAKARDEKAFSRLVNNNRSKLYRIGKSLVKQDYDVDDAIQETIIKAWIKIDSLKENKNFDAWIASILVNECYTILRKRRNTVNIEDYDFDKEDTSKNVDSKIDILKALDKLKEENRMPLILYFFEDFSYEEISMILKIPKGTIKSRISRGKEKLEDILRNYGGGVNHEQKS